MFKLKSTKMITSLIIIGAIALIVLIISLLIVKKRSALSKEAFDEKYQSFYIEKEIIEKNHENEVIKHNLYYTYLRAYDNFAEKYYSIEEHYNWYINSDIRVQKVNIYKEVSYNNLTKNI